MNVNDTKAESFYAHVKANFRERKQKKALEVTFEKEEPTKPLELLAELEEYQERYRVTPPVPDMFGVMRAGCSINKECPGYEAIGSLINKEACFPTTCKHCGHAAYFHKVIQPRLEDIAKTVKQISNRQLYAKNLAFHGMVVVYRTSGVMTNAELNQLHGLLKNGGYQVLSSLTKTLEECESTLVGYHRQKFYGSQNAFTHSKKVKWNEMAVTGFENFVKTIVENEPRSPRLKAKKEKTVGGFMMEMEAIHEQVPNEAFLFLCLSTASVEETQTNFRKYHGAISPLLPEHCSLLYSSADQISAVWDTQLFFPQLFAVQKSCIFVLPKFDSSLLVTKEEKDPSEEEVTLSADYQDYGKAIDILQYNQYIITSEAFHPYSKNTKIYDQRVAHAFHGKTPPVISLIQNDRVKSIATCKVGLPLYMAINSADMNIVMINKYQEMIRYYDVFFPQLSENQRTVLIFRPFIVRSGLVEVFLNVFKLNGFGILKRTNKVLSHNEILMLSKCAEVPDDLLEFYITLMGESESELVVVSKFGAISEAKALCDGNRFGRRQFDRTSNIKHDLYIDKEVEVYGQRWTHDFIKREKVDEHPNDGIDGLFSVNPFNSISEMIDVDSLLQAKEYYLPDVETTDLGDLNKYKYSKTYMTNVQDRLGERSQFRNTMMREVDPYQNVTVLDHKDVTDLDYERAQAQETKTFLEKQQLSRLKRDVENFSRMFNIVCHCSNNVETANREIALFFPQINDYSEICAILKPSFQRYSSAVKHFFVKMKFYILETKFVPVTEEFIDAFFGDKITCDEDRAVFNKTWLGKRCEIYYLTKPGGRAELISAVGRRNLLDIAMDTDCDLPIMPSDAHKVMFVSDTSRTFEYALNLIEPKLSQFTGSDVIAGSVNDRIYHLEKILQACMGQNIYRKAMEGAESGLLGANDEYIYGIAPENPVFKFAQLMTFIDDWHYSDHVHFIVNAEKIGPVEIFIKRLRDQESIPYHETAETEERIELVGHSEALKLYYREVQKNFLQYCPGFFQYRVLPIASGDVKRAYSCEEHMGELFLIRVIKDFNKCRPRELASVAHKGRQRGSMSSFVWGRKLGEFVDDLETIQGHDVEWAGDLKFDEKVGVKGTYKPEHFYSMDREFYREIARNLRKGIYYYLNNEEISAFFETVDSVLDSPAFRYTRNPDMIRLIPREIATINLRIFRKYVNDQADDYFGDEFRVIDPQWEFDLPTYDLDVASVAETNLTKMTNQRQRHRDVALSKVDPIKYTKKRLAAAVYWHLNFELKSFDRQERLLKMDNPDEYDVLVDGLIEGFLSYYKDTEFIESISLLRMEYYLYGLYQADKVVGQIKNLQDSKIRLTQERDEFSNTKSRKFLRNRNQSGYKRESDTAYQEFSSDLDTFEKKLEDVNKKLEVHDNILSAIFNELLSISVSFQPETDQDDKQVFLVPKERYYLPTETQNLERNFTRYVETKVIPEDRPVIEAGPSSTVQDNWFSERVTEKNLMRDVPTLEQLGFLLPKMDTKAERDYRRYLEEKVGTFLKENVLNQANVAETGNPATVGEHNRAFKQYIEANLRDKLTLAPDMADHYRNSRIDFMKSATSFSRAATGFDGTATGFNPGGSMAGFNQGQHPLSGQNSLVPPDKRMMQTKARKQTALSPVRPKNTEKK